MREGDQRVPDALPHVRALDARVGQHPLGQHRRWWRARHRRGVVLLRAFARALRAPHLEPTGESRSVLPDQVHEQERHARRSVEGFALESSSCCRIRIIISQRHVFASHTPHSRAFSLRPRSGVFTSFLLRGVSSLLTRRAAARRAERSLGRKEAWGGREVWLLP